MTSSNVHLYMDGQQAQI